MDFPEQLPHWAIGFNTGNDVMVGAQLCTKDGRKCGNAFIYSEATQAIEETAIYSVITDIGGYLTLTASEIIELFYISEYLMDTEEAKKRRQEHRV